MEDFILILILRNHASTVVFIAYPRILKNSHDSHVAFPRDAAAAHEQDR